MIRAQRVAGGKSLELKVAAMRAQLPFELTEGQKDVLDELSAELARLPAGGNEGIPVVRSLQRRLLMLAPARARVDRGERVDAVMASYGASRRRA